MDRALYSIDEARQRLGRISRNSIYALLRTGELSSVIIGCRRFISAEAIDTLVNKSRTLVSPSHDAARSHRPLHPVGRERRHFPLK